MVKEFGLTYSNGAYIQNLDDSAEWQQLFCPCQPRQPYRFKLREKARLHVLQENEAERTHFSLPTRKWIPKISTDAL
jgi:hypothetical protein